MKLSIPHASQWLIHGLADDTVPPAFSRDYVAAKHRRVGGQAEDVNLREIANAGHFDLIDPTAPAWKQVQDTVLQLIE
jgi:pimeloyl-ACP methyl ester carboxylesterase